jgi:hypothetical protein
VLAGKTQVIHIVPLHVTGGVEAVHKLPAGPAWDLPFRIVL